MGVDELQASEASSLRLTVGLTRRWQELERIPAQFRFAGLTCTVTRDTPAQLALGVRGHWHRPAAGTPFIVRRSLIIALSKIRSNARGITCPVLAGAADCSSTRRKLRRCSEQESFTQPRRQTLGSRGYLNWMNCTVHIPHLDGRIPDSFCSFSR